MNMKMYSSRLRLRRAHRAIRLTSTVCIAAMSFHAADAQETDAPMDEEIVVSAPEYVSTAGGAATKSDTPLIETPQSVTIISRDQIDLLNWTQLQQVVRYTAGATGENYGPDERVDWLTVRGFYPIQYIDGLQAPYGSITNIGTDLYGFQSVDILKGPSSVLYGQTPPGGIVNMVSRRPTSTFEGELGGQYGTFDHKEFHGFVSGPATDSISVSFTGLGRDRDTQLDLSSSQRVYVAPAVAIDLADRTRLTLLGYYQYDKIKNGNNGFLPAYGTLLPNPLGEIPRSRNLGEPDYNLFRRTQYAIGYEFSHEVSDALTIEQNLKYFDTQYDAYMVYGGGFVDANANGVPDDYRTVIRYNFPYFEDVNSFNVDTRASLKFATGPVEHAVLAGFDYRHYDILAEYGFALAPTLDIFNPVYGAAITTPPLFVTADQTQKQYGVYLQDQMKLGGLVLTLGGRQDWLTGTNGNTKSPDVNSFSYRVGANYVLSTGIAPYVQTAKSFQPVGGADRFGVPFDPTEGVQYEAGIKYDGRTLSPGVKVFASIALYELKQKNVLTPDPTSPTFSTQTGEVRVRGVEIEASARIRERLSLNFAYGYTDSEITRTNRAAELGKRLAVVPKHKLSGLVDYTFQTGTLAGLGGSIGARYESAVYGDLRNLWKSPGFTLFDASLHFDTQDWRFALTSSNLFDKRFISRCTSVASCYFGSARTVIGSATYKF